MAQTVLIVVEGGRIQDIYTDAPDTVVVVKDFDDLDAADPHRHPSPSWPVRVVAPHEIGPLIDASNDRQPA